MSLTGDKIKEVFRKLLYTNDTTSPASLKITAADNSESAVTSLAIDITGNAATATNGVTTASAVTTLSGNSGGRATTITAAEGTSIATNTTNIASNDTDIATNVTAIALNTAKVTYDGATQVATNVTNIASNVTNIATNVTAIALNTAKVTYDDATQVATNVTDIATNATNITGNDTDIATNVTAIGLKAPKASPTFTGTVVLPNIPAIVQTEIDTKQDSLSAQDITDIGNLSGTNSGNVCTTNHNAQGYATTAASNMAYLAISTAATTYAPLGSPTFTGTVAIPNYANVETTLDGIATNATAIALNTAKVSYDGAAQVATNVTDIATNATNIALRTDYGIGDNDTLQVDEGDGGMTATSGEMARFTGSGLQSIGDAALVAQLAIDDDSFLSAASTTLATSESIKAYVDANAGGGGATKHWMDWHYYNATITTQNYFYSERWNDEYGVSSSINTDLASSGYSTTTSNNAWRLIRSSRPCPYAGTLTKFIVAVESTGADPVATIEVAVWKGTRLSLNTQHTSGENHTIAHLGTLTFAFSSSSRFMHKELTSFNATGLTEADWIFITVRKTTTGTNGSYFSIHSTMLWDGD